jgi:dUTP pyrophosphatase
MEVLVRRLTGNDDVPLPAYSTAAAAGLDLCAAVVDPCPIEPGTISLIPCGIAIEIPQDFEGQVRPRSGLASRHGITLVNAPGTIDSDYRGEVKVPLINLGKERFVVTRGMRIAQLVIAPVVRARIREAASLSESARGAGGFGHTGL